MYGAEQTDLVVKYYDVAFGVSGEAELAWYLHKARQFGGPVLDLACGTGRLALLLAREGFEVAGMDQSAGMLNLFQAKLQAQEAEIQGRVTLERQKMSAFSLGRKFHTILCCDAFFHNLTVQEEMDCLACVARHLAPNGRFVFNLPNPTCEFILKSASSQGKIFEERTRVVLQDGSLLVVDHAQEGNLLAQTITTTLRLRRTDPAGELVEQGESTWISRYLFPSEAVHLLYRCGFEVEALMGSYRDEPVSEGGQLIFQARLALENLNG